MASLTNAAHAATYHQEPSKTTVRAVCVSANGATATSRMAPRTRAAASALLRLENHLFSLGVGASDVRITGFPYVLDTVKAVDWLKRTTHQAEDCLRELKIPDWVSAHRRSKLHWARRLPTTEDHTWTWKAMMWEPDPFISRRSPGHPRRRLSDDFADFLKVNQIILPWHEAVQDKAIFQSMLKHFAAL